MSDTPRTDAVEQGIDSNDCRAWRSVARQLERELTAARKDAERYRWLRQFGSRAAIYVGADKGKSMEIAQMQQLDGAIDAAIEKEGGEK